MLLVYAAYIFIHVEMVLVYAAYIFIACSPDARSANTKAELARNDVHAAMAQLDSRKHVLHTKKK